MWTRHRVDFSLTPVALQLPELVARASPNPLLNSGRTGPAQTIPADVGSNLPVLGRDFAQLTLLSPQAVLTRDGGVSFAGQSDRLNGFQIDGASNADLGGINGLSGFGTPGSANGVRTLSVEAIKELQILIAPYDVRYGNFAGGLVNAVTRSGSNRWEGSVSSYFQGQGLTGRDPGGQPGGGFLEQRGDRHPGRADRSRPSRVLSRRWASAIRICARPLDRDGHHERQRLTRVRHSPRVRRALSGHPQKYLSGGPGSDRAQRSAKSCREPLRQDYAVAGAEPAHRSFTQLRQGHAPTSWFSSSRLPIDVPGAGEAFDGQRQPPDVDRDGKRRLSNELTVARLGSHERCLPSVSYPEIDVQVSPEPDRRDISAGVPNSCARRFADQTVWELTDNASLVAGAHHLTLGTHEELLHLNGSRRVRVPAGRWHFSSLDALQAGQADGFIHDFAQPGRPEGPVSNYDVHQVGRYAQDQWSPLAGLTLTAGLRFDVPFLPRAPELNQQLLQSNLGINTGVTPTRHVLWSPRLGFNYDVGGRGTKFLRGGVGLFSGRPIYLYFSNAFETTGLDWQRVECEGADAPAFTVDPDSQPTNCVSGPSQVFEVNYFGRSFRYPRNLRLSLGADVALPWRMVGTVDLLYIRGIDQFDITDVNLNPPTTTSAGEGGRLLYGTIDPNDGRTTPSRRNPAYATVAEMRNSSGDRTYSATAQLQKQFAGPAEVSMAYTWTDARDRMSADCFNVTCNIDFTPLDGTLNDRRVTTSRFEARHKVTLEASVNLLRFHLGLFYNGYAGQPYTYLVDGDANADGYFNDIVYVPKNATDITLADPSQWAGLDSIIRSDRCLSSQRGTIMRRNSCRNQWTTIVNARLSRLVSLGGARSIELIADIFNLPQLLSIAWGVHRVGTDFGDFPLLFPVGYDEANQRMIYFVEPPDRQLRDDEGSRWRMQLGARYTF